MGNWRTVNITGTMTAQDAATLRDLLDYGNLRSDRYRDRWNQPYACLLYSSHSPCLCGLDDWPAEQVSRCGNLAERGYAVEDVHEALLALVPHAPSMLLQAHCGGEYESEECVATVLVGEGLVRTVKPQVATVSAPSTEQMMGNLYANLVRG